MDDDGYQPIAINHQNGYSSLKSQQSPNNLQRALCTFKLNDTTPPAPLSGSVADMLGSIVSDHGLF